MSAQPETEPEAAYLEPLPPPKRGDMTLVEHLFELRNRVVWIAATVLVGVLICLFFWETIFGWLIAPAPDDPTTGEEFTLASFSPLDRIGALFQIGLYGGLILASPMIVYQILAFITPGLTSREKKMLFPGLAAVVGFLLLGMAFAYWIILPRSLGFLLGLGGEKIEDVQGIKQYMDFVTRIIFWVGISFELPVVIAIAAKLGLVRAGQLLRLWRYMIVVIVIMAAVITPTPDPLTQLMVAGPLLVLYFVGILFAAALQPRRPSEPATAT